MKTAKNSFVIKPDGTLVTIKPANGKTFALEEAQGLVGGYIEIVRLSSGCLLIVNEEGKMQGLAPNLTATALAKSFGAIGPADYIVGDVIFCSASALR